MISHTCDFLTFSWYESHVQSVKTGWAKLWCSVVLKKETTVQNGVTFDNYLSLTVVFFHNADMYKIRLYILNTNNISAVIQVFSV